MSSDASVVRMSCARVGPALGQEALELRTLIRLAECLVAPLEALAAERVVGRDLVGRDSGQRQHQHRDLTGPVAAAEAVDEHAAGLRVGDRREHARAALREALEVRGVVERRGELRAMHPVVPEAGVVDGVERQVDRAEPVRALGRGGRQLVVVAQVDDRAHTVVPERRPAGRAEPVEAVGTHDGAAARHAAVGRREVAEVASVEAAVPVEMAAGRVSLVLGERARRAVHGGGALYGRGLGRDLPARRAREAARYRTACATWTAGCGPTCAAAFS